MNKRNFICFLFLGLVVCSGCQKDGCVSLDAVVEQPKGGEKVYLDDEYYVCWADGDDVKINNGVYRVNVEQDYSAHIDGVEISEMGFTAGYPADRIVELSPEGGNVSIDNLQYYGTQNGFQRVDNVLVGYAGSADEVLYFRNVGAVMGIKVENKTNSAVRVDKIQIKTTAEGAYLSGEGRLEGVNSGNPMVRFERGKNDISLVGINQRLENNSEKIFYLFIPVVSVEGNCFEVSVLFDCGEVNYRFKARTKSEMGTIARNQMGILPVKLLMEDGHVEECNGLLGEGSETEPYLIYDEGDLKRLSSGNCYLQMGDLSCSDDDLYNGCFSGKYDGGGHLIELRNTTRGVFVKLGGNTEMRNLKMTGTLCCNNVGVVGGLANLVEGNNVRFENCKSYVHMKMNTTSMNNMGGICGRMNNCENVTFERCYNWGEIECDLNNSRNVITNIGGVVGFLNCCENVNIVDCFNNGNLKIVAGDYAYTGGIVGKLKGENSKIVINRCGNTGILSVEGDYEYAGYGQKRIGGIVGYSDINALILNNCFNRGKIANANCAGGLAGNVMNLSVNNSYVDCDYENCYQSAGIVSNNFNGADTLKLDNCYVLFDVGCLLNCSKMKWVYYLSGYNYINKMYVCCKVSGIDSNGNSHIIHVDEISADSLNNGIKEGYSQWELRDGKVRLKFESLIPTE